MKYKDVRKRMYEDNGIALADTLNLGTVGSGAPKMVQSPEKS